MAFNTDSKHPTRRAYVVKVRADGRPMEGPMRLPVVARTLTGRQGEFAFGCEVPATSRRPSTSGRLMWNASERCRSGSLVMTEAEMNANERMAGILARRYRRETYGRVVDLSVREGDQAESGQVLARQEDAEH